MEIPKPEPGRWNHTAVVAKKYNLLKKKSCNYVDIPKKVTSASVGHKSKSPKCFIKITGSRYDGAFLVSVDPAMDDAIYKTMREIEIGRSHQLKHKPSSAHGSASPKNCLSSVFRCFTQSPYLQDFKKKYSIQPQKNLEGRVIKDMAICGSRPVCAKLPKDVERLEANKDVVETYKSTSSKLNKPEESGVEVIVPREARILDNVIPSTKASQYSKVDVSNDHLKKKYKRFSEDETLMVPLTKTRLKCKEGREVEIGLDVTPNTTAKEVSRSIKLAQDETSTSIQDGNGVLHINEPTQKRSLHNMTIIEEHDKGNPSLKLSVNKGSGEETNMKQEQGHQFRNGAYSLPAKRKDNVQMVKMKGNDGIYNKRKDNKSCKKELGRKKHRSTEVQASEGFIHQSELKKDSEQNQYEQQERHECHYNRSILNNSSLDRCRRSQKPPSSFNTNKRFPCNRFIKFQNPHFHGGGSIFKFARVPDTDANINRTPYLVHTLYEPYTSSLHIPRRKPEYLGAFYRLIDRQTGIDANNNRVSQKTCYNDSAYSSNRDEDPKLSTQAIADHHENPTKRDFGVSTSAVEDFERVLQNICGPNYWYHRSETSNINRNEEGISEEKMYYSTLMRKKLTDLSCDRWSQTENLNGKIITEGRSQINYVNLLGKKNSLDKMNSDNFNEDPYTNIPYRKSRTVHTCTRSNTTLRNAVGNMTSETVKSGNRLDALDVARSEFLSKFKSYQNDGQLQNKPTLCCYDENTEQNRLVIGDEFKEGITKRKDFSFEMSARKLDEGLYFKRSEKAVGKSESGDTSSSSMNNSFCHESQMSIINMALCNGLRRGVHGRKIYFEEVEEKSKRNTPEVVPNSRIPDPIKIKSRSCQNIFVSCDLNSKLETLGNVIPKKTKKQRYHHLTSAGSSVEPQGLGYGFTNIKERLELEGGMEKTELKDYNGSRLEERSSWRFHDLPPEIGSLFLPRPGFPCDTTEYRSELCGNQSAYGISLDRLSTMTTVDALSDRWCASSSGQVVSSYSCAGPKRCSMFHRTILTIKNVFRKKITGLFGKKSTTESLNRDTNRFTFNKHDKIVFIPVPLEKKNENIHLFKNNNNFNF